MNAASILSACHRLAFALCALGLHAAPAAAQFPSKPVTVIVPFPPGGITDTVARMVVQKMADIARTAFVIENRSGASGIIGTTAVARAAPDGHTLLLGAASTMAVVPHVMNVSYAPNRDFVAVGGLASVPSVLISAHKDTYPDFAAVLRESQRAPGQLTFGSAGIGTSHHVQMSFLNLQTGMSMLHVPYKGSGPAMADLLGGQIDFLMDPIPTALPQVRANRVVPIAAARSPLLADVPTFIELGVQDFVVSTWFGLFAPAATAPEIVERLGNVLVQALQVPEVVASMQSRGVDPMPKPPREMAEYVAQENMRWQRVMTQTKIETK